MIAQAAGEQIDQLLAKAEVQRPAPQQESAAPAAAPAHAGSEAPTAGDDVVRLKNPENEVPPAAVDQTPAKPDETAAKGEPQSAVVPEHEIPAKSHPPP